MKKVLLTLLAIVVVLGLFAATGYAGYRFGYAQGAANGQASDIRPFDEMGPNRMPMPGFGDRFDRGFDHGFGSRGFAMRGFGFFPLMFLGRIALLALIVLFIYWLFTRGGWQLTRTRPAQTVEAQPQPTETESKE